MSTNPSVLLTRVEVARTSDQLRPEHFIHPQGLQDLSRMVAERVQRADTCFPKTNAHGILEPRVHEAILVHGSRGSGKTTFVVDFLNLLTSNEKNGGGGNCWADDWKALEGQLGLIRGKISSLGILDPTLLHEPQSLIVLLVALIREKVVTTLVRAQGPENPHYCDYYKEWHTSLQCLAKSIEGANLGRHTPTDDGFTSSGEILEVGLQRMHAGHDMEARFHHFVCLSLKLLKLKAFLLVLDDIDTKSSAGWHVLEVLRKYCTTPQLITIVLGDLELYTMRVRHEQLQTLGKDLLEHEKRLRGEGRAAASSNALGSEHRSLAYDRTIHSLETQYLAKVLPPRFRISLMTLADLVHGPAGPKIKIMVVGDMGAKEGPQLVDLLDGMFQDHLGLLHAPTRKEVTRRIMSLPVRTIVNLLPPSESSEKSADSGPAKPDQRVIDRLTDALIDIVAQVGIRPGALAHNEHAVVAVTVDFLKESGLWGASGGQGIAGTSEIAGLGDVVVTAWINQRIYFTPGFVVDYMLRFGAGQHRQDAQQSSDNAVSFATWAGIRGGFSPRDYLGGRLVAWRVFASRGLPDVAGAVRLLRKVENRHREGARESAGSWNDTDPKRIRHPGTLAGLILRMRTRSGGSADPRKELLVSLPIMSGRMDKKPWDVLYKLPLTETHDGRSTASHISIFPILEFMGHALRAQQRNDTLETSDSDGAGSDCSCDLRLYVTRTKRLISLPRGGTTAESRDEYIGQEEAPSDADDGQSSNQTENTDLPGLVTAMQKWAASWRGGDRVQGANAEGSPGTPLLPQGFCLDRETLEDACARFESALADQANLSPLDFGAGHALHLQCVTLFNAVLLAEDAKSESPSSLRSHRVLSTDRVFNENFGKVAKALLDEWGESEQASRPFFEAAAAQQTLVASKRKGASSAGSEPENVASAAAVKILAKKYPLLTLLLSCPIWLAYLQPGFRFGRADGAAEPGDAGNQAANPYFTCTQSVAYWLVYHLSNGVDQVGWLSDNGVGLSAELWPEMSTGYWHAAEVLRSQPSLYPIYNLILRAGTRAK